MSTNVKNEGFPLAAIRQISSPEITAIYGGTVTIPDGWELVAWEPRVPEKGEYWLNSTHGAPCWVYYATERCCEDRLIVRKAKVVEAAKSRSMPVSISGDVIVEEITTVKDIYGVDEVEIPEGYRYVGFRVPKGGERGLDRFKPSQVLTYTPPNGINDKPRIIVEKVEPPKPTYEFVIHTVETPGSIDKVRYMATTTMGGKMSFYCEKNGDVFPVYQYLSASDAPVLYLSYGLLAERLKARFTNYTVRRAKTV